LTIVPAHLSAQIEFGGQVVSGRGITSAQLLGDSEELRAIVKGTLYPGSLNVILNQPLRLLDTAAFMFSRQRRMLWPASLNGADVWIYRWCEAPLHVVEVLSTVHLREHLALKDGDDVILRVSHEQIGAINPVGRFTWVMLWAGRRHWFYSSDTYYNRILSLCEKLGAARQQPVAKGLLETSLVVVKEVVKRSPAGALARKIVAYRKTFERRLNF
jgi:hypothetical protein